MPHSGSNNFDSHPFRSMSIDSTIPTIQLFQILSMKIQGEGHGVFKFQKKKAYPTSYQLTPLSFVQCQSVISFLRYSFFTMLP